MSDVVPQLRKLHTERFDCLGGLLPGRAAPTDLDQLLEHGGHFLFMEYKRPGQAMTEGQRRAFKAIVELGTEEHTVQFLVIVGNPPADIAQYTWFDGRTPTTWQSCTCEQLRALVLRWWHWTETT